MANPNIYPRQSYHQYCEYHKLPGGLKRLDFIVSQVRRLHQLPESTGILDIGCGNGNTSIPLASLGYTVLGIDIDLDSIREAKRKNPFPNASFRVSNLEELTTSSLQFDVVICAEVLEHVIAPEKLISHIYALLKPDGILIATIPNGVNPRELWWLLVRRLRCTRVGKALIHIKRRIIPSSDSTSVMSSNIGVGSEHVQNFTLGPFCRMVNSHGFETLLYANHMALMNIFYPLGLNRLIPSDTPLFYWLEQHECKLADQLPSALASGWYFIFRK